MSGRKGNRVHKAAKKARNRHENVRLGTIRGRIFDSPVQTPNRKILISTACYGPNARQALAMLSCSAAKARGILPVRPREVLN